jgi:peptidoglycan hydrolase-like protein with peptidoglycan-binding domain
MHRLVAIALLILTGILPASAKKRHSPKSTPTKAAIEAATRLQVFLDRANYSPGRIDGRYNEFTWKALALYRQSRGEQAETPAPQPTPKSNVAPDVTGLDLKSVNPVFIPYAVTEADLQSVGRLPKSVAAKAKMKFLPYANAADALAEKFHCDVHFLEHLDPDKLKKVKAGDQLMVPNV